MLILVFGQRDCKFIYRVNDRLLLIHVVQLLVSACQRRMTEQELILALPMSIAFKHQQRRQKSVLLFVIANCYIAAAVHIKYDRKLGAPVTINTIYDTETRSVRKVMSQT